MRYTEGYLAFLDILGFSQFVSKEENGEKTADLFQFVRNFCYLFNSSKDLNADVAFFSDSIVITSLKLDLMLMAISMAEGYLQKSMGLLYRGGICYGKYYHQNGVTFGPAVIDAYKLEQQANYSRIIVSEHIDMKKWENSLLFFKDIDGHYCMNPFLLVPNEEIKYGMGGLQYPDGNAEEILLNTLKKHREATLQRIEQYRGSSVVEKYIWRTRAFNYTCDSISQNLDKVDLLTKKGITPSENLKTQIRNMKITMI